MRVRCLWFRSTKSNVKFSKFLKNICLDSCSTGGIRDRYHVQNNLITCVREALDSKLPLSLQEPHMMKILALTALLLLAKSGLVLGQNGQGQNGQGQNDQGQNDQGQNGHKGAGAPEVDPGSAV